MATPATRLTPESLTLRHQTKACHDCRQTSLQVRSYKIVSKLLLFVSRFEILLSFLISPFPSSSDVLVAID